MKEKDIRAMQLDDLKSGIWRGKYYTVVKSFDGRIISKREWATKEACDKAYENLCVILRQAAIIDKVVEFIY